MTACRALIAFLSSAMPLVYGARKSFWPLSA